MLKPRRGMLIARREEPDAITAAGLIIPEPYREKNTVARVLLVGTPERDSKGREMPIEVSVGDLILLGRQHGWHHKWQGEEVVILRQRDVVAILQEERSAA